MNRLVFSFRKLMAALLSRLTGVSVMAFRPNPRHGLLFALEGNAMQRPVLTSNYAQTARHIVLCIQAEQQVSELLDQIDLAFQAD